MPCRSKTASRLDELTLHQLAGVSLCDRLKQMTRVRWLAEKMKGLLHAFPFSERDDDGRIVVLPCYDKFRPVGFDLVEMRGQVISEVGEGNVSHDRPPGICT